MKKEFDPSRLRKDKYGTTNLDFLSREEYEALLVHFTQIINHSILEIQEEFKEGGDPQHSVVGVVIYGSWARAAKKIPRQVHRLSDLDLYLLVSKSLGKYRPRDFPDILRDHQIGIDIHSEDSIVYTNRKEVKEEFLGRDKLIGKDYVIVTPYPEVSQTVQGFLK